MQLKYARRSEDFFGETPYPIDLDVVEARDGASEAQRLLLAELPAPPARILDLGCGHGRHAGPLSRGAMTSLVSIFPPVA